VEGQRIAATLVGDRSRSNNKINYYEATTTTQQLLRLLPSISLLGFHRLVSEVRGSLPDIYESRLLRAAASDLNQHLHASIGGSSSRSGQPECQLGDHPTR
jgi:hypothetical protein